MLCDEVGLGMQNNKMLTSDHIAFTKQLFVC